MHVLFRGIGLRGSGGSFKGKEQKVALISTFGSKQDRHYVDVHLVQSAAIEEQGIHEPEAR